MSETPQIKIVQINLRRSTPAANQLVQYAIDNGIDMAIIQEPPKNQDGQVTAIPLRYQIVQKGSAA